MKIQKVSKVQIRVTDKLKTQFENAVKAKGLDLSTAIRVMMVEFTNGNLDIGVKTRFDQEVEQGKKEYKKGEYLSAKNNKEIDDILDQAK